MSDQGICRETCDVLAAVPSGRIEVVGESTIADELRRRLGCAPGQRGRRAPLRRFRRAVAPLAIVDTTGDADALAVALARVATGGIVALAGDRRSAKLPLDLYPDVHVRGVRMIGVPGAN